MHRLYPGISTPEAELGPCRGRVKQLQWQIALQVLRLDCSVVVDWGVWSRAERDACQAEARAAGARVVLCFLEVPFEELWDRVARRNAARPANTFEISENDLLRWSELFEPPTYEELALYDPPGNTGSGPM
jgi:predicted kinase